MRHLCFALVLFAFTAAPASAQDAPAATVPFDVAHWTLAGDDLGFTSYLGRPALRIHRGTARLRDGDLATGDVEFDMAFQREPEFAGLQFHSRDEENFEYFYVRPHHSGTADANQYLPMMHGDDTWQIYHGPEYSSNATYVFGGWNHVRIVVYAKSADVFINGVRSLRIPDLKHGERGGFLALNAAPGAGNTTGNVYYANFRATRATVVPAGMPEPVVNRAPGLVRVWRISEPMAGAAAERRAASGDWTGTAWRTLPVETNGIANVNRLDGPDEGKDVVIARFRVDADRARPSFLRVGYSDRVAVYINGARVFEGDNHQHARDSQFLGIVGLFDAVAVPLRRGHNEIAFVVEERSGGWAAMAQFADITGLHSPDF